MAVLAVFGIENDGLNLAVNLLLLFLVVIYVALIYWTWADARRRIDDPMLVGCATAASLFPFIGTIIYLIVRPPEFLDDVRERELEMAAAAGAARDLRPAPVPALRLRRGEGVPALPELPAPPEGAVQRLRQAARPALEDLPLLRGGGRPGSRGAATAARQTHHGGLAARVEQAAAAGRGPAGRDRGDHRDGQRQAALRARAARPRGPRAPAVDPNTANPNRRSMDRTLILVKPDAFERALTGEILARFERKGLRIVAMKQMTVERELAERHYAEHSERPFFGELVDFITGGPLVALVLEGHEAVVAAAPADRGHQPARGRAGLDPRRLRARGADQPRARIRLARVGGARDRPLLPGAVGQRSGRAAARPRARARPSGGPCSSSWAWTSASSRPRWRSCARATRARWCSRTPFARPARWRALACSGRTPRWCWARELLGKPRDAGEAEAFLRRLSGREHEVMSGLALRTADGGAHRRGGHPGAVPPALRAGHRLVPGHRRVARAGRAATRSRAAEPRWWSRSRATTGTWSGCRCRPSCASCPTSSVSAICPLCRGFALQSAQTDTGGRLDSRAPAGAHIAPALQ